MTVVEEGAILRLSSSWTVMQPLDEGGFGRVYLVAGEDGQEAAAKLVPKAPGSQRELLFADLGEAENVVPIIDSGEHDENWVLVMPRAEKSLLQRLSEVDGPPDVGEAVSILRDIAVALASLQGRVVHRDLKPGNVLYLQGRWQVADFGIARYADASTASDTRKYSLSPPYAAPEQWRTETATAATDVYAWGLIAFELFEGRHAFEGAGDWREAHLHQIPPKLELAPPSLAGVIEECLYKSPESRPAPAVLLERLLRYEASPPTGGLARLQEANRAEVRRRAEAAREASEARSLADRRALLAQSARDGFEHIVTTFQSAIQAVLSTANMRADSRAGLSLDHPNAALRIESLRDARRNPWGDWEVPLDVVSFSEIYVVTPRASGGYKGRSHSLWYCDAQQEGSYAWYEVAFMVTPMASGSGTDMAPFALDPGDLSGQALWRGIAMYQLARPFVRLPRGELDDFVDRWAGWYAAALDGRLQHPPVLPESSPEGSWRR